MGVSGVTGAGKSAATYSTADVKGSGEAAYSAPTLGFAGLGVEALAAMLTIETAQESAKALRQLQEQEGTEQVAAIQKQADELHAKADDIRSEGAITIGASALSLGATTLAIGVTPGVNDADQQFKAGMNVSNGIMKMGDTVMQGGSGYAKISEQGAEADHDANAAVYAERAKFAETAKEQYESLAKDANDAIAKAQDALNAFVQERMAAQKAIWQR